MYFSALKTAIQHLEEKRFYDVALMYLEQRGYQDLSIVDGTGDGGRDVVCSREDLRIQLSVRKDWETKINDEALKSLSAGKRHLIFVTNRPKGLSPWFLCDQHFVSGRFNRHADSQEGAEGGMG